MDDKKDDCPNCIKLEKKITKLNAEICEAIFFSSIITMLLMSHCYGAR